MDINNTCEVSLGALTKKTRRVNHTAMLATKPKSECRWDIVSLGEVMLRLDPGDGRIHTSRTFQAGVGGGEDNVARGL